MWYGFNAMSDWLDKIVLVTAAAADWVGPWRRLLQRKGAERSSARATAQHSKWRLK
jgi:hypothetical protein